MMLRNLSHRFQLLNWHGVGIHFRAVGTSASRVLVQAGTGGFRKECAMSQELTQDDSIYLYGHLVTREGEGGRQPTRKCRIVDNHGRPGFVFRIVLFVPWLCQARPDIARPG